MRRSIACAGGIALPVDGGGGPGRHGRHLDRRRLGRVRLQDRDGGIGGTFHWTNNDSITHTTTQNGPRSLWNSGNITAGNAFSKTIDFAGSYPYHCSIHTSMTGSVKIPAQVTPTSGSVGATFAVNVADRRAPSGLVYDVQRKKGSGRLDGVEDGDHLEVRDVRAADLGDLVVPVSSPQDLERAEERLVAGAIDLRRLGVLAIPRC